MERYSVKKVTFRLKLGIIGDENSGKELLCNYLENNAIKSSTSELYREFLVVHNEIPFKVQVYSAEKIDQLILKSEEVINLDVIIFAVNIYDLEILGEYTDEKYRELCEFYSFQGISVLAGINSKFSQEEKTSDHNRIDQIDLITKSKELNILYCYEIENESNDVSEVYSKVLNDIIQRFKFSKPDLYNQAREYGRELVGTLNS